VTVTIVVIYVYIHDLTFHSLDRPAFVAFVTAGFPSPAETVDILLGLEKGGADVIELGKP
jgi:tryptophan synthase